MSDIQPYGMFPVSRDARRAARTISRYSTGGQIRMAQIDVETDVSVHKTTAVTDATGAAMSNVARICLLQRQLEAQVPEAAARLALLADDHALSMADLLADLRRKLRRL